MFLSLFFSLFFVICLLEEFYCHYLRQKPVIRGFTNKRLNFEKSQYHFPRRKSLKSKWFAKRKQETNMISIYRGVLDGLTEEVCSFILQSQNSDQRILRCLLNDIITTIWYPTLAKSMDDKSEILVEKVLSVSGVLLNKTSDSIPMIHKNETSTLLTESYPKLLHRSRIISLLVMRYVLIPTILHSFATMSIEFVVEHLKTLITTHPMI